VQTIQLTAQVDDDGMLWVQMPEGLKNTTVEATIVFIAASDRSKSLSRSHLMAEDRISWTELVHSLAGSWAEDFPSLTEIRTETVDTKREIL
jgi:hypothetical protein